MIIRIAASTCLLLATQAAAAQTPSRQGAAPAGRTIARATSGSDTSQAFAVYLPSAYSTKLKWPLLFVMDPRGRAMLGLELFATSAERYGFVVISSYNTLSDGAIEPNIGAVNAMLSAAQSTLSIDLSRLYIAGFSGTARIGWSFAVEAPKNFAGLLAAGAAPILDYDSVPQILQRRPGFALALTAGYSDFNWSEVRTAEQRLADLRVSTHVDYFPGEHGWPPASLIDRALAWFKLRGMLDGRWDPDTAWMGQQIRAGMRDADSLESSGQPAAAADAFSRLALALRGQGIGIEAERRARTLFARGDVAAMRARVIDLIAQERSRSATLSDVLRENRRSDRSLEVNALVRRLGISDLKRLEVHGDSLERPFAARVLASAIVSLGFYEPRYLIENKQARQAVTALRVLAAIMPWNKQHCLFLEQARALMTNLERSTAPSCE